MKTILTLISLLSFAGIAHASDLHNYLLKTFQMEELAVREHDEAMGEFLSEMEDCPYSDSLVHQFKSFFGSDCDELIEDTLKEQPLSYFLMVKKIEKSGWEFERKEHLIASLKRVKDDLCQNTVSSLPCREYLSQEQDELVTHLGGEMEECHSSEDSKCRQMVEKAKELGLSYFQVRHSVFAPIPSQEKETQSNYQTKKP